MRQPLFTNGSDALADPEALGRRERGAVKEPMTKRLKLTIQPSWRIVESQSRTENAEMDEKTKAIVGLLKALQRRTNAEVEMEMEEGAFTMT